MAHILYRSGLQLDKSGIMFLWCEVVLIDIKHVSTYERVTNQMT